MRITMKKIISLTILLSFAMSCEGPETTVTNIIRRDGSILRKVEMNSIRNEFKPVNFRVPVDSTWKQNDSISISVDGDTTWYLFAEKEFDNANAINAEYLADSGANKAVKRTAFFERKFKWFTTSYYFSEKCEKSVLYAYPVEDFLSPGEIKFMNLTSAKTEELMSGPDSTYYKSLSDSLDQSSEEWLLRSFVSEWIEEAGKLCTLSGKDSLSTASLRSHEDEFLELPDSLDFNEAICKVMGESCYEKNKTEFDSAMHIAEARFDKIFSFKNYTLQMEIPENIISTNGILSEEGMIAWPVRGELFLNDDYVMYATSRSINYWAFFLTILFLIFIAADLTGHVHKRKGLKK